jgi:hypothetical protein
MSRSIPDHCFEHGQIGREVVALAQEAEANVISHAHAAVIGLLCLGQHSQQGALTSAVAANDANAISLTHAEGDLVEEGTVAVGLGH